MNIDQQALATIYAAAYVNQRDFSGAQIKLSNGKLYNLYEGVARHAVRDFVTLMRTLQAEENSKAENSGNLPDGHYENGVYHKKGGQMWEQSDAGETKPEKPDFMDQVVYDAYGFPIK